MEYLIAIVLNLAAGLAIVMLAEKAPRLSRWIVLHAARLYAEPKTSRFTEEWLAHLETRDGPFSMLWHATGCLTTGLRRGEFGRRWANRAVAYLVISVISVIRTIMALYVKFEKFCDVKYYDGEGLTPNLLKLCHTVVVMPFGLTIIIIGKIAGHISRLTTVEDIHIAMAREFINDAAGANDALLEDF